MEILFSFSESNRNLKISKRAT